MLKTSSDTTTCPAAKILRFLIGHHEDIGNVFWVSDRLIRPAYEML